MFWKIICMATLLLPVSLYALPADDSLDSFMAMDNNFMIMDEQSNALKGFDVVSFFDGTPVKGRKDFQLEYLDVKWIFANQKNLDKFFDSPHKYIPKYEGYCTYALSLGQFRDALVDYWLIYEDELYFFCDEEGMKNFQSTPNEVRAKAEKQWSSKLKKMLDAFL